MVWHLADSSTIASESHGTIYSRYRYNPDNQKNEYDTTPEVRYQPHHSRLKQSVFLTLAL